MEPIDRTRELDVAERVAASKARLADKLDELARRVDTVKEKVKKARFLRNPWFLLAAAAVGGIAVGLSVGRKRAPSSRQLAGPAGPPGIGRAVLREILVAAAGAMTRRYFARMDASGAMARKMPP